MELTWKYTIKIKDENVFKNVEEKYGVTIPDEVKNLVIEANAGTPSKIHIRDEHGNERVFGTLLSYNDEDDDNIFHVLEHWQDKKSLPFAVDPFGNHFAIDLSLGNIIWKDHETDKEVNITETLEEMLQNLY